MLTFSALIFWLAASTPTDTPLPPPGSERSESIGGTTAHRYVVAAPKDTTLVVNVLQEGIDLVVEVRDATGALLLSFDSPNGIDGPETATWVSGAGGRFTVVVRPLAPGAPAGRYRLSAATRPATKRDADLMAARLELARGYERRDAFDYAAAREAGEHALRLMSDAVGAEALETSDVYDLLGYVYDEIGLFDRGAEMFGTALAIRQRTPGVSDSVRNGTETNLAWLELGAGRYADAERRFRAVAERRMQAGELAGAANALTGQAAALNRLQRYGDAEAVMRAVLTRAEPRMGPNATSLDYMLRHLAVAMVGAGRAAEGRALCERALALPRANLWDEMGRGYDLRCVGMALAAEGRFAEAQSRFNESLEICVKQRGGDSLCAADTLEEQAKAARSAGDVARSRAAFERALAIRTTVLPATHPEVVELKRSLSELPPPPG